MKRYQYPRGPAPGNPVSALRAIPLTRSTPSPAERKHEMQRQNPLAAAFRVQGLHPRLQQVIERDHPHKCVVAITFDDWKASEPRLRHAIDNHPQRLVRIGDLRILPDDFSQTLSIGGLDESLQFMARKNTDQLPVVVNDGIKPLASQALPIVQRGGEFGDRRVGRNGRDIRPHDLSHKEDFERIDRIRGSSENLAVPLFPSGSTGAESKP